MCECIYLCQCACVGVAYVYYSPQRRHGDNSVPEWSWDAGELAGAGALLCIKHDRGKDDDGHGEWEEEEAQLRSAALECITQDPQALRVAGELEDTKHSKHTQCHEGAADILVVGHH